MSVQTNLVDLYRKLAHEIELPDFSAPVAFTYNPLIYAQVPHKSYLKRYGNSKKRVRFFGMNPGSWGMGQTGTPFGDITSVRELFCNELLLYDADGKNITPDRLSVRNRHSVIEICDKYANRCIAILDPQWAIGIGKYVERRLDEIVSSSSLRMNVFGILHPSPASLLSNSNCSGGV